MALPTYQTVMLPLLRYAQDMQEHSLREATIAVSDSFGLSEEERSQLLGSGRKPIIDDRVGWARTYLGQAKLLESTRRGFFRITARGIELLQKNPTTINDQTLKQYIEFLEFLNRKSRKNKLEILIQNDSPSETTSTPEELLESAHQTIRNSLAAEILEMIMTCSPNFFERLVVELLVKMGYGGTLEDAGQAIGKSGDGGIDGIIKEDRLGLDAIYLQAKRWENTVGSPEIQKFAGALQGRRAKKGVFITTSEYSKGARDFASAIENKII